MDQLSIFSKIPRGKNDKPILLMAPGEVTYDINDVDGTLFMLDREMSGCLFATFSKPMDPAKGICRIGGRPVRHVLKSMAAAGGLWMLGYQVRGTLTDYGQTATVEIEGFMDTDGNVMDPVSFTVRAREREEPKQEYQEHEAIALKAAEEGIVLLKNEGNLLPLKCKGVLNIFGGGLHSFRSCACGAGKISPRYSVRLREAVLNHPAFSVNKELDLFYRTSEAGIPGDDVIERAKMMSDIAFIVITRASGENMDNSSDRGEFYLSGEEELLIAKLSSSFKHTIAILNVGYPMDVSWADKYGIEALLYTGFGGMLAGKAIVNVLDGTVNPSGKLPDTWAVRYEDIPASRNFYDCAGGKVRHDTDHDVWIDTVYEEDIYVGYRYFDTFGKKPAYPFGWGLSYTSFDLKSESFSYDGEEIRFEVTVSNTGNTSGKQVVQAYIGKPDGKLEKPAKELIGFEKTKDLASGESEKLLFRIPKYYLTSYDEETAAYIMEKGTYRVFVGTNCEDVEEIGRFELKETEVVRQAINRMQPVNKPDVLSKNDPEGTYPKGEKSGVKEGIHCFEPEGIRAEYPLRIDVERLADVASADRKLTFADVINDESLLPLFVAQMSVEELARTMVCASSGWGMEGTGEAGRLYQTEGYDFPEFKVADGNSGVNMYKPNIGFPSGATLCASFNKQLVQDVGRVIGEEAKELGVDLILAPALNIHRNPLNGRQSEYFSEDPYLAGIMSGCYCKGLESTGVGGCYKHCIANNAESSRKRNQSIMTERALREIYFRAFEIAMKVHQPVSIMTAYNAVNGVHTAADTDLIQ